MLLEGGTGARYSPSGHIVFWRSGSLYAAPFDLEALRVSGSPQVVQTEVSGTPYAAAHFAISRSGTLIFAPGPARFRSSRIVTVDRSGTETPLPIEMGPREIANLELSRDGSQLAFAVGGATDQIWIHDLDRGSTSPLTFEWDNIFPTWAPDGRDVAFWSNRGRSHGIFVHEIDGARAPEQIYSAPGKAWPTSWSADGQRLLFMERRHDTGWDLMWLELNGEPLVRSWLSTKFDEGWGLFSPNGRWVAHESRESGRLEIYVRPFEESDTKWRVSAEGGRRPRWSPSGRELFYWEADHLVAVDVRESDAKLILGKPRRLFENDVRWKHYDVTPDGKRFVVADAMPPPPAPTELQLVLNWAQNLGDR